MNLVSRLKPAPAKERVGDGLQTGFEIVGTIVAAFLIGWGLDSWLGTTPWFMIGLTVAAAVAKSIVMFSSYSAQMDRHADRLPKRPDAVPAAEPTTPADTSFESTLPAEVASAELARAEGSDGL